MLGGPVVIIPLVAMLIIGLYSYLIQKPLKNSIDKTLSSSQQKNAMLIESLSGMEALKIAQAESDIQYRWEKSVSHIATWSVKTKLISSSATTFSAYVQQMANIGMVIAGVFLISNGELSMGGLIASVMLSGRCLAPMAQIAGLATRYNQSKSALDGLNQIMDMPSERREDREYVDRPDLSGSIEFDDVSFTYPGQEIQALKEVNLTIKPGEKIGIIGRIGSGKTTIEKLILGLYEPEKGSVRVDGIDLKQINPTDLRSNIGCVSQDITLFYGSIKDNIVLGANHVEDSLVLKAAEISGVTEFANKHPCGLDMIVGERGQNLSGGQRQSIALARALLMDPPILVMDEPSSSMDNTTELRVKDQLRTRCANKTLILVTHKASMLDLVDRLIVVDGGSVVADGPKDEVHTALRQRQTQNRIIGMSSGDDKDIKDSNLTSSINEPEQHKKKPERREFDMSGLKFNIDNQNKKNIKGSDKKSSSHEDESKQIKEKSESQEHDMSDLKANIDDQNKKNIEGSDKISSTHEADAKQAKEKSESQELDMSDREFNIDKPKEEQVSLEKTEKTLPPEDMEYISDTNVAMLIKSPKGGRLLIYTMLLAVISAIVWASFARLDEITRGTGIIIPSSRLQVIQNLEGGILEKVFVKEGEEVRSGQKLMQLDDTRFSSSFREGAIEYFSELAKVSRLKAELSGEDLTFPTDLANYPAYVVREREIYNQRADSFRAELNVVAKQVIQAEHELKTTEGQFEFLTTSYELGKDELDLTVPLARQGVVSRVELIQLKQRVNELESQMSMTELSIPKLKAAYQEAVARKEEVVQKYRSEIIQELKKTEVHLDQLGESNSALEDQVDRTVIRSPMDGIIKKIHVTTIGGVVQPGMSLLDIVPLEDNLMVEAQIQPKDIGFLREGVKAIVKFTAYDFAIYGGLEGEVVHISADTIKDEQGESFYIVRIRTQNKFLGSEDKPLLIIPGMRTNVDIITGDKTLMAYLLKPILRAKQNALTER